MTLANGRRALLLGQKSAVVFAVDPDRRGSRVVADSRWARAASSAELSGARPATGETYTLRCRISASRWIAKPGGNDRAYVLDPDKGGGLFALRVDNGERMWQAPPPGCLGRPACSPAQSAAITGIPGVVWSGSEDGHLRAYSTSDGKIVWDYDTAHEYSTVNGVAGHGGTIDVAGPVVVDGMVFSVSGYPSRGGMSGNVLLAFGE